MTIANPAITWPNHTTLVTGVYPQKHGVLYNGLVVRGVPGKPNTIEPWADKAKLVRVPTVYDAAFHAGLTTAEIDWVAITCPGTINWSFAEIVDPTAVLPREMVAAGVVTGKEILAFAEKKPVVSTHVEPPKRLNAAERDELWTRAASFVFTQHRPNPLMFHPLNTDGQHHRYGPGSAESRTALAGRSICGHARESHRCQRPPRADEHFGDDRPRFQKGGKISLRQRRAKKGRPPPHRWRDHPAVRRLRRHAGWHRDDLRH